MLIQAAVVFAVGGCLLMTAVFSPLGRVKGE